MIHVLTVIFQARCLQCSRSFCCANCRWNHEQLVHGLQYDCPLCRGFKFLCTPELIKNTQFMQHIFTQHLPLHCGKCKQLFTKMDDFINLDKCVSLSELVDKDIENNNTENHAKEIDQRFNSIYSKMLSPKTDAGSFEAIVSINKISKTAVITPVVRSKYIVDYDSSDSESNESSKKNLRTPHSKAPKTPRMKRMATPHIKKFLIRQRAIDADVEENEENEEIEATENNQTNETKTTPARESEDLSKWSLICKL